MKLLKLFFYISLLTVLSGSFEAWGKTICIRNHKKLVETCGDTKISYATNFYYREGPFIKFFTNGKIAEQGQYIKDFKSGKWKQFYRDGKLKSVIAYFKGIHCDKQEIFDKKGKVLKRYIYMPCLQAKKFYAWPAKKDFPQLQKIIRKFTKHKIKIITGINLEQFYDILYIDYTLRKSFTARLIKKNGSFKLWTNENDIEK